MSLRSQTLPAIVLALILAALAAVDIADGAIISVDRAQRILLFNQGAERIFGYPAREVLGQPLDLFLPERFLEAHHGHILEFADSPITVASRRKGERRELLGRRAATRILAEAPTIKPGPDRNLHQRPFGSGVHPRDLPRLHETALSGPVPQARRGQS